MTRTDARCHDGTEWTARFQNLQVVSVFVKNYLARCVAPCTQDWKDSCTFMNV